MINLNFFTFGIIAFMLVGAIIPIKIPESKCVFEFINRRIKKKQGCIILTSGDPGKGKSYFGLRLLEIWYWLRFKERFPVLHICKTLEEAVLISKDITRTGEGILIEEISVLAGRRDSLTKENRLWNAFLDTIRIKQLVIVGNCPHLSFVDKHFVLLSQMWIEVIGVNFRKKITLGKPMEIQMSQHKTDPYTHKFVNDDGDAIDVCYMRKPSPYILEHYDKLKTDNTNQLYQDIADKMVALKNKRRKELGQPVLAPREQQAVDLKKQGLTAKEIAMEMKLVNTNSVYKYLINAQKKGVIVDE